MIGNRSKTFRADAAHTAGQQHAQIAQVTCVTGGACTFVADASCLSLPFEPSAAQ